MKIFYQVALAVVLLVVMLVVLGQIKALEKTQRDDRARINSAMACVEATREAQEYAAPLIALSEQLAHENAMFTEVIDRARTLVQERDVELAQTKEALSDAVKLLQGQISENNQCVDRIRELERLVYQLLDKIPEGERPAVMPLTPHPAEKN